MNKKWTILVVVVACLIAVSFVKDIMVKIAVETGVRMVTGLRLSTKSFRVGIIKTVVDIKGLRLYNPVGFEDRVMVDMPEVYVDYDLPAILGGKIHLRELRIHLKEFLVVKNNKGQLNLDSLKVARGPAKGGAPSEAGAGGVPKIQIDKLRLKIGKAVYKDYSAGAAPSVREFNVNIDEQYTDITDPYMLVSLIAFKAISNTTISSLTNFDMSGMRGNISGVLGSAKQMTGQATAVAQDTIKKAQQQTKDVVKDTQDTVKKTADTLKDVFKSPFGGNN